ncbi:MAG TPA: nuclear transport factor 2 family protein [Flavitalea sp.]|nr:nuclear transport factor 2 family protein [Flavitalea sp.]
MEGIDSFFQELYKNFNLRKIDEVLAQMIQDVKWANGMEGGYVHGQDAVRDYWTRQFAIISSTVTPLEIEEEEDETVKIKVHQVVHDLNGQLLADEKVYHFFMLQNNKIAEFHIGH